MAGRNGAPSAGAAVSDHEGSCLKLLLSSASFSPSYGGPAYSVLGLAQSLAKRGMTVAVWSPDGSAPTATMQAMDDASDGVVALRGSFQSALSSFGAPDVFHDSGLWWGHNREIAKTARRLGRPLVVSLRGMLEPAALKHRSWKKRIAWHLYQRRNLENAAALHVTGDLEAKNVRVLGLRPEIICIANGLFVPKQCPDRDRAQLKRVVFLGRLHPIKGLPMLLEAWARIRPPDWSLEIAGPDEGGHRRVLEDHVIALALDKAVCFTGAVSGEEKKALFARGSLFVLPSLSESFGVAAGEAMAAGLPVIATHGTPWAALETEGCGWHVATSVDGIEGGLRRAFSVPEEELIAMGQRGHRYAARAFSWDRVAGEMATLYQRLMD